MGMNGLWEQKSMPYVWAWPLWYTWIGYLQVNGPPWALLSKSVIESKTDKQKEKAEQGLAKAMVSLESALKKVADAQVQYEIWVNQ